MFSQTYQGEFYRICSLYNSYTPMYLKILESSAPIIFLFNLMTTKLILGRKVASIIRSKRKRWIDQCFTPKNSSLYRRVSTTKGEPTNT
mmetsp:Transcript_60577/g.89892  ORF Transcript_60577/g.89892 Transcript_60577/m.89892 type:complete len:89 (-) Transcript_60577:535-801(-)